MYKLQICYSNFQDNKLFIFLNYEFIFFSSSKNSNKKQQQKAKNKKKTTQKTKATRQRKLELYNYNIQLQLEIYSYIKFYCFLTRYYNWQLTKPKILPTLNCTKGFIVSNFLLVRTAAKLRNSQIYGNCQLWYSLIIPISFKCSYISLRNRRNIWYFQISWIHLLVRGGKNVFAKCFCLFIKWKSFSDISIE